MRARRRRAGCGGGPTGRAARRRRLSSAEPRAPAAPWPGPRAARGGAAGGRRAPAGAGAAAAASRRSPGRSAARTPPAREERSCCSSPGRWARSRCAARRRRRPSESGERRSSQSRRLRATRPGRPQRPRPAAQRRAEAGGRARKAGACGRLPGKRPATAVRASRLSGVKKRQTQPKRSFLPRLPLRLAFSVCSASFLPYLPLSQTNRRQRAKEPGRCSSLRTVSWGAEGWRVDGGKGTESYQHPPDSVRVHCRNPKPLYKTKRISFRQFSASETLGRAGGVEVNRLLKSRSHYLW
nr:serine/arginine repetitive matrix protein 1-like [Equus caballus]